MEWAAAPLQSSLQDVCKRPHQRSQRQGAYFGLLWRVCQGGGRTAASGEDVPAEEEGRCIQTLCWLCGCMYVFLRVWLCLCMRLCVSYDSLKRLRGCYTASETHLCIEKNSTDGAFSLHVCPSVGLCACLCCSATIVHMLSMCCTVPTLSLSAIVHTLLLMC